MHRFWQSTLARFARVTSSGRYIPEVDGLRFVAITMVVVHHVWTISAAKVVHRASSSWYDVAADHFFQMGWLGVPLFFMISGFILALPFLEAIDHRGPPVRLANYFFRRLTRLEPPYILSMLLFFIFGILAKKYDLIEHWPNLLASLLYVHNLVFSAGSIINNNAWSLEIEVQFYILVPLLVWVFRARVAIRRSVLVLAIFGAAGLSSALGEAFPKTLLSWLQYFCAGLFLSDIYLSYIKGRRVQLMIFDVLAVLAWGAITCVMCFPFLRATSVYILPFLFLAYGVSVFCGRATHWLHVQPILTVIGGMCYSIYLLHARIISIPIELGLLRWVRLESVFPKVLVLSIILFPLILGISALFFFFVEKPCMRRDWFQHFIKNIKKRNPEGRSRNGINELT